MVFERSKARLIPNPSVFNNSSSDYFAKDQKDMANNQWGINFLFDFDETRQKGSLDHPAQCLHYHFSRDCFV